MDHTTAINWPLMTRQICEAYMGLKPQDVAEMTMDQITILVASKDNLREWGRGRSGKVELTPDQARAKGLLADETPGESLAQRIRRETREKRRAEQLARKRQRLRQRQREAYEKARQKDDSADSSQGS